MWCSVIIFIVLCQLIVMCDRPAARGAQKTTPSGYAGHPSTERNGGITMLPRMWIQYIYGVMLTKRYV